MLELFKLENIQWLGFLGALIVSLICTPKVISYAHHAQLLSPTGGRHIHEYPVPRLGGIAIYLATLIICLLLLVIYGRYTPSGFAHFELLGIFISATLIFIIGLLDDLHNLPALTKLIAQIFIAIIAWFCEVQIRYLINPLYLLHLSSHRVIELDSWLSFIITIGWLILITNALNLIDGLDGLAGGIALITSISLWALFTDPKILQLGGATLMAILAGGLLGFLRYNYNPARIFLGDSGSYFIGFLLGATAVAGLSANPNTASIGSVIVIAFSFPLIDTAFAVIRRLLAGKHIMSPDADHIHHRILRIGLSPKATMLIIIFTSALLGMVASLFTDSHKRYLILILLLLSLAILNIFWKRHTSDDREDTE